MVEPISRVVLFSSAPLFREGLRGLLEQSSQVEIVAMTESWEETLELVRVRQPEAVIVDREEHAPVQFLDELFAAAGQIRVILLSHQSDRLAVYTQAAVEHPGQPHLLAAVLGGAPRPLSAAG